MVNAVYTRGEAIAVLTGGFAVLAAGAISGCSQTQKAMKPSEVCAACAGMSEGAAQDFIVTGVLAQSAARLGVGEKAHVYVLKLYDDATGAGPYVRAAVSHLTYEQIDSFSTDTTFTVKGTFTASASSFLDDEGSVSLSSTTLA